jgi:hypothetical protein
MNGTTDPPRVVTAVGTRLGTTRRWLVVGVLGLMACTSHAVSYVVLDQGVNPGRPSADPYFAVVTHGDALKQVFGELHANQLPVPPPPEVDFERSTVVLAVVEQQPTAGYSLHVTRVVRDRGILRVELRMERPPPGGMLATVVTQPYVLIQVDRDPALDTVVFVGEDAQVLRTISVPRS